MERYKVEHQPMRFGKDEVKKRVFKKVETHSKVWYIPIQDNAADDIHVCIKNENKIGGFRGYGGATLQFLMEDGTVDDVNGPWHSNSDSLYRDTGIDLRDKTATFGVIGKGKTYEGNYTYIEDVVHKDDDWTLGSFYRIENLAQTFADNIGQRTYFYSQSTGGSHIGWKDPK